MVIPRVIPCVLIKNGDACKTVKFREPTYVGDPVNIVRIFSEKEVDELAILDISASREGRPPDLRQLERLAGECFMPASYGGGITTREQARTILRSGFEKVIINTASVLTHSLIHELASEFGSQSVVCAVDVGRDIFGKERATILSGTRATRDTPEKRAEAGVAQGAGEVLLTSIGRDGCLCGYDLELIARVASAVNVPVIANGGARGVEDFAAAASAGASACAGGAMFVFHGRHRAVLITAPSRNDLVATLQGHRQANIVMPIEHAAANS